MGWCLQHPSPPTSLCLSQSAGSDDPLELLTGGPRVKPEASSAALSALLQVTEVPPTALLLAALLPGHQQVCGNSACLCVRDHKCMCVLEITRECVCVRDHKCVCVCVSKRGGRGDASSFHRPTECTQPSLAHGRGKCVGRLWV